MPKQYAAMGLSLMYPDNWRLTEDCVDEVVTGMTLESPEGAFFAVNCYTNLDDVEEVILSAKAAMESEYDEVESETEEMLIAGVFLQGTVQRFYYLDLIITSKLFAIVNHGNTYLIQIQGEDRDIDRLDNVFQAILTSMLSSISSEG